MPTKSSLPTKLSFARALIVFVALSALAAAYYWAHKPFGDDDSVRALVFTRVGGAALDLVTVAALFAIAGGIGRAALRRFDLSTLMCAERLALEGGIGLGLVALAALIAGLVGLYRPLLLWGLLILLAFVLRKPLRGWLSDGRDLLRAALRVGSVWDGMITLYCVSMLALALVIALAPPTHWDSLTYHLVAPQRYLQAGAITAQPDNFYMGLSQNVEMLYGLTMGLFGRPTAAAPVHFGFGVLALLATVGVTRRFAGRSAGRLAALLLLSAYGVWALFGWAYVDHGALLYGALALGAATAWRETRARGWLILIGAIIGLALGVKYTTVALGAALGLFVFVHEPRRVVRNGIIVGLAALLAFAPWAAKGLFLYRNPVYPFLFDGLSWNTERSAAFNYAAYNLIARGDGWQLPILPVAATIFGVSNTDGFDFTLGPWLMTAWLLLPLVWVFLDGRARRFALDTLTLIAPLLVFWVVMAALISVGIQTRLMVMAMPAFAAAGAVGLHGLAQFPKKPVGIHFIVRAALAATLALTLLDALRETVREKSVPYLLGQVEMGDYMYANTGAYYDALQRLPPGSQVRLMWEPRGFYCPPTVACAADVLFDQWKLPMLGEGLTPDQVFERYRDAGDDYLLVFHSLYEQYLDYSTYPDLDRAFPAALERRMTPVWTDGIRYTLYGWTNAP